MALRTTLKDDKKSLMVCLLTSQFVKNSTHRQTLLLLLSDKHISLHLCRNTQCFRSTTETNKKYPFLSLAFLPECSSAQCRLCFCQPGKVFSKSNSCSNLNFSKLKCITLPCIYKRHFQDFFSSTASKKKNHFFSKSHANNSADHQNFYTWNNTGMLF